MAEVLHIAPRLVPLIRKSIALTCLGYVATDLWRGLAYRCGTTTAELGARHQSFTLEQSISYIETVYHDYLRYGGLDPRDARIAEVGPGDNLGVAFLMLQAGARSVTAVDRFYSNRDPKIEGAIYEALASRYDCSHLFEDRHGLWHIRGLGYVSGVSAERFFQNAHGQYDAIVSRAVLEHVQDPIRALNVMAKALAPGGRLIHDIDFRDHGMFANHHPLTFLTIPGVVYRNMVRYSGRPNRTPLATYRNWLKQSPLNGEVYVRLLVGLNRVLVPQTWDDIEPSLRQEALNTVRVIRPRLRAPFCKLGDEDLAVAGAWLVAEKR